MISCSCTFGLRFIVVIDFYYYTHKAARQLDQNINHTMFVCETLIPLEQIARWYYYCYCCCFFLLSKYRIMICWMGNENAMSKKCVENFKHGNLFFFFFVSLNCLTKLHLIKSIYTIKYHL